VSGFHYHLSEISVCKTISLRRLLHSTTNSSFHAHNLLLQLHASPPSSQPRLNMSATVHNLLFDKLNRQLNRERSGTSPNHLSYQKKVLVPSPTLFDTPLCKPTLRCVAYPIPNLRYLPPPKRTTPAPYLQPPCLLTISRHQKEQSYKINPIWALPSFLYQKKNLIYFLFDRIFFLQKKKL